MAKPKDLTYIFVGLLGVGVVLNYLKDKIQLPGIGPGGPPPPPPGTPPEPQPEPGPAPGICFDEYGSVVSCEVAPGRPAPYVPPQAPIGPGEGFYPFGPPFVPIVEPPFSNIPIGEISTGESIRALIPEEQAYFPPGTVITVGGQVLRPEEQAAI